MCFEKLNVLYIETSKSPIQLGNLSLPKIVTEYFQSNEECTISMDVMVNQHTLKMN